MQKTKSVHRKLNPNDSGDLIRSLRPIVEELSKLKRKMKAMGLFTQDRDLVECPRCHLGEDVTFEGRLVTARPRRYKKETGLQFKILDIQKVRFQCPSCKCKFRAHEGPLGSDMAVCKEEK